MKFIKKLIFIIILVILIIGIGVGLVFGVPGYNMYKEALDKENIEAVLEKLNVKNKEEILNINWFNSNKDTYEKIENTIDKSIKNNKKTTIIIGGNKNYISENNETIMKYLNSKKNISNIKIIDCYNVEEVGMDMKSIVKKYDGLLNTSGEVAI